MSLLIDVLRRAESGTTAPPTQRREASPVPARLELEPLAEPAPMRARPTPAPSAQPHHNPTPATTAAVPSAGQPTQADAPRWRHVGLSAGMSALAALAWLWLAPPAASAPAYPASAPSPAPAEAAPPPPPVAAPVAAPPPRPHRATTSKPSGATPPPSHPAPSGTPIHFDRNPPEAAPFAAVLSTAHEAYGAGDLPLAEARYREALASAPDDPDALDGLGAIALQAGQHERARQFFRRALLAHPLDPTALAGLARTEGHDPMQAESRLKDSLVSQPDASATHLALGDTLAAQQRWAEAQQAYFQAHSLAPDHPDIAYNLAVALDHLGQRRPAASFYRQALLLAERHPARFSRPQCETRLHTLQAQDPSP